MPQSDPTPASAIDLAELERLAAAASPLPWTAYGEFVAAATDEFAVPDCCEEKNANYIAAAANAVPGLVAEVRRLRALAEAVRETFTPNRARDGYGKLWAALDALELWEQQP